MNVIIDGVEYQPIPRKVLAVVEGKSVYEGDELYNKQGIKFKATYVFANNPENPCFSSGEAIGYFVSDCSWNPPAPAIPDGFTPHNGGECPVSGDVSVDLYFGGGGESKGKSRSYSWEWSNKGGYSDIIGYKIHKPTVMVELLVEDAEYVAGNWVADNIFLQQRTISMGNACRKALEAK